MEKEKVEETKPVPAMGQEGYYTNKFDTPHG